MVVRAKVIPVRISSFACWSNSAAPACICPWAPAPASLPGSLLTCYHVGLIHWLRSAAPDDILDVCVEQQMLSLGQTKRH
ncbi:hypothetical protein ACKKBF_B39655 [Auxenochlorella protothecoides x Auxenochlorella symbiontica]